ncbi:DUF5906 domain-containing protein [Thioclava sp. A2]|uniref:primase-helicase family protein n=1 Tax=Thioclava sp. FCG-A2 TaxID=3080562 RepID=UPI002952ACDF|nr:DUF5906 domain-containing protein [Thioclava sp. A2]MDV7272129.1 DUF5906 domain-containing protein [Thioclava sp. A2]
MTSETPSSPQAATPATDDFEVVEMVVQPVATEGETLPKDAPTSSEAATTTETSEQSPSSTEDATQTEKADKTVKSGDKNRQPREEAPEDAPQFWPPDPPDHLERWDENLSQHIEKFAYIPGPDEPDFHTLSNILQTIAQWYVRKDSRYYDVEEPGPAFSRDDVERLIIQRIKEEFPGADLSEDAIRQLLQVLIKDIFVDPRRSIPIWSGLRQSMPGNPNRLTFKRMAATINTWREPSYRQLSGVTANWGLFGKFMETTFQRQDERDMLINWLAWCLQNEDDKPGWAPFLFSLEKGSGKSTFAKVAGLLFGEHNFATENNINKLVSRFNAPILEKKLVICEELYLPPGSDKANAIKTFITERQAVTEHKFNAVQQVDQVCCFIFITNHKPIWLEEGDRRFYVVHVDHEGHRLGPQGAQYAALVADLLEELRDPRALAALYAAIMAHALPSDFNAHSLDVNAKATALMRELQESSIDVSRKGVEEYLNAQNVIAVTFNGLKDLVEQRLGTKVTALKHVLADLGWSNKNAKWGNSDYRRVIWLRPGYQLVGDRIKGPGNWELDTGRRSVKSALDEDDIFFKRPNLFSDHSDDRF